jgi:hypothetical protein
MAIAAEVCVFTNDRVVVETVEQVTTTRFVPSEVEARSRKVLDFARD